jgi:hypothetical protein
MLTMTDAVITEYAGTRRNDTITRFYQYGSGGVRVLDGKKVIKRVYRFDPSSDMMTERDPKNPDRILRRFVFDRMGMLEESFSSGSRPRTFRYEQGGQQIAVREGGEYGQVGKIFSFEDNGISETAWGRNGEIERVFVFEAGNDTITERAGGWFGDVERTILFAGIHTSLFREPEAFLQFLMFTEWSDSDREERIQEQVAKIRGVKPASPGRNPYAYSGARQGSSGSGDARGRETVRTSRSGVDDAGIEFIPEGDAPAAEARGPPTRRSEHISFDERLNREVRGATGRSAEIPLSERFESARRDREPLSKGRSVEIPISERFEAAHQERTPLSRGRSVEIPLEERFGSSHEKEKLSRGGSVDIPLEERFESARGEREKLSKGRSAEIPYSERRGGRDR